MKIIIKKYKDFRLPRKRKKRIKKALVVWMSDNQIEI